MPLDREHISRPSRIMLPTYIVGYLWFGLGYMLTPDSLINQSPVLHYAETIMSMEAWGLLFVFDAGLLACALAAGYRRPARHWHRVAAMYALLLTAVTLATWTAVVVASTLAGVASFGSGALPFICTAACFASYVSLLRRDI